MFSCLVLNLCAVSVDFILLLCYLLVLARKQEESKEVLVFCYKLGGLVCF